MSRWQVWRAIFREAWSTANLDLGFIRSRLIQTAILYAIYILLVFKQISEAKAAEELELKVLAGAAPLLVWPIIYAYRILTSIPDREIRRNSRLNALRERPTPKLEISLLEKLFQMHSGDESRLALSVKNTSVKQSDIVSSFLTSLTGDNKRELRDPIEFSWQDTEKQDQQWTTIPAGGRRTCKMFYIDQGCLKLPPTGEADDRTFFENGTTFKGIIVVEDRYYGATSIRFTLNQAPDVVMTIDEIGPPDPQTIKDIEEDKLGYG